MSNECQMSQMLSTEASNPRNRRLDLSSSIVKLKISFQVEPSWDRKLVDERMQGTNVLLEYSPERWVMGWERIQQLRTAWKFIRMAVPAYPTPLRRCSFTGTELDFALDVCNGVVDVPGALS